MALAAIVFVGVSALEDHHSSHGSVGFRYAVLSLQVPHVANSYQTYTVMPGSEGPAQPNPRTVIKPAAVVVGSSRRSKNGFCRNR